MFGSRKLERKDFFFFFFFSFFAFALCFLSFLVVSLTKLDLKRLKFTGSIARLGSLHGVLILTIFSKTLLLELKDDQISVESVP